MKDFSLEYSLYCLREGTKEYYAPSKSHKEEDEKISEGPTGLWGWFRYMKEKFNKK